MRDQNLELRNAIGYNDLSAVKKAVENGADINASVLGYRSETPLIFAVASQTSDSQIVDYLLSKGANVNYSGLGGFTALHIAAYKGNGDVVDKLLAAGADPTAKNGQQEGGNKPSDLVWRGGPGLKQKLLDAEKAWIAAHPELAAAEQAKKEKQAATAKLNQAIRSEDIAGIKALMAEIKDRPDFKTIVADVLIDRIYNGGPFAVQALIDNGADPNAPGSGGLLPIVAAAPQRDRDYKMFGLLLDNGAVVDIAVIKKLFDNDSMPYAVETLVARKVNLDVQDENGDTPLMLAIKYGKPRTAGILIQSGVKIDIANKAGETALDMAKKQRDMFDVVKALAEADRLADKSRIAKLEADLAATKAELLALKQAPAAPPSAAPAAPGHGAYH